MYEWYSQLTINITWRGCYSKDVDVNIGTRQGGLSSPLLFNIFYQDLIDRLSTKHCGISINKESFERVLLCRRFNSYEPHLHRIAIVDQCIT